jgi:thiol-disulfide isomerase/thioredoxin
MIRSAFAFAVLPALVSLTTAQKLAVGDQAPELKIAKWVKGDAVASFQPGKVYVVEFWATWCGPCIASMPHLTALQGHFAPKGVTIIGVTSVDPNNALEQVEALVAGKGDGIGYTVAWDDGSKTNEAYMKASGQRGIPCSFLVDGKGTIAYIGHPMGLDIPLAEVVAGTWDPVKGKARVGEVMKRMQQLAASDATEPGQKAKVDAFLAEFPTMAGQFASTQFHALLGAGKLDAAYAAGKKVVEAAIAHKNEMDLNDVAWSIVDPEQKLERRDLELAMQAAQKAVEFTKEKDGAILDTLARVWFWKKDYQKALEWQKKAVTASPREDLKKALEEYEKLVGKGDGEQRQEK